MSGTFWVYVEWTDECGSLSYYRYVTVNAHDERAAAEEAFGKFAPFAPETCKLRSAQVFRESPAQFFPFERPRYAAVGLGERRN